MNQMEKTKQLRKQMKQLGLEPNGEGFSLCDDIKCKVCKKHRNEKAPRNT